MTRPSDARALLLRGILFAIALCLAQFIGG